MRIIINDKYNAVIICLFFYSKIYCQTSSIEAYCDCEKAFRIDLIDSLRVNVKAPYCIGKNDIKFTKNTNFFQKEHNTAWFIINIKKCGVLTFTISPLQNKDDYDFMIFNDSLQTCGLISKGLLMPIRSNLAKVALKESRTGLDKKSKRLFCNKESTEAFSKRLNVEKNQTYFLVIDNLNKGKGSELNFKIHEIENFEIYSVDYDLRVPILGANYYFLTKNNEELCAVVGGYNKKVVWNFQYTRKYNKLPVPSPTKWRVDAKDFDHVMVTKKGYIAGVLTNLNTPCSEAYNVYLKKLIKGQKYYYNGIYITEVLEIDIERSKYFIHALMHTINSNGGNYIINDIITKQQLTIEQKQVVASKLVQMINVGAKLKVDILIDKNNPESKNDNGIILKWQ